MRKRNAEGIKMYRQHPMCELPSDPNAIIWRYVDFTRFVSLLEHRCLHFTRTDTFQDKFEGALTRPDVERMNTRFKKAADDHPSNAKKIREMQRISSELNRMLVREYTAVNCWHVNQHESAAMWEIYARNGQGVAVRSTVQRLIESFDEHDTETRVMVGLVNYIDYTADRIPQTCVFYPLLFKRLSFEHETELRAVAVSCEISDSGDLDWKHGLFEKGGADISVDLQTLVECVYVAPSSPTWYRQLVRSVVDRYELKTDVHTSDLDTEPIW